ncbi:MAG: GspJ family type II secretion system protein [Omnitrophica bacterium]|nr:GspJ family type II secretion system protein [Candidatus Omnitrophota bacterium]
MKKAFTLIEILVAMAILVIVIVSSLAIFRAAANSWRKGEIRAQRYQQARFILERMSREISSIFPASLAGPYCLGTAEKFYFITSVSDAQASLIEVGYWLDQDSKELMRSYQGAPDYDFSTFEKVETLSENILGLGFQYSTGALWQESWDSRLGRAQSGILPKAVKIEFVIEDEKEARQEAFSTVVTLAVAQE